MSYSLRPRGLFSPWNSPGQTLEWVTFPFSRESSQPRDCSNSPFFKYSFIAGFDIWYFLLGRKTMTNLDSILKSRDITLPTKVHLVKARRRQWHPTPVLLPGKSHGRRSLVGYSSWGHEESDSPGKPNLPLGLRGKAGGCARVTAGPKRPHLGGVRNAEEA